MSSIDPALQSTDEPKKGKFMPKHDVKLAEPKDDPYSVEELARRDGSDPSTAEDLDKDDPRSGLPKVWVAMKGKIFDVTGNKMYMEKGSYQVFAGKDASRALALTSTKLEDVRPDWEDLADDKKKTLDDWVTFFTNRYNIVGRVVREETKL